MKGVLGAVLAVHSVIVCVCVYGAQMDCTEVTWREEKTHVAREMDWRTKLVKFATSL